VAHLPLPQKAYASLFDFEGGFLLVLLVIRHCWLASVARLEGYACFKFHHAATGPALRWVSDEDFVKSLFSVAWRQHCHNSATMDDIPFLSPASVQWLAYHYLNDQNIVGSILMTQAAYCL
jgi:hypothetical protein